MLPFLELPYFNGLGGFTPDGKEYATYLKPGTHTPSAWVITVMANPTFGAMVSESGLGCTWSGNSQANRLTPWHNDPVTDPQSEAIYIRDDETGAIWTPTPSPVRENDAYRARHGQGYTTFEHNSHAIGQQLTVFVPTGDPVKVYRLQLRNDGAHAKRLTITYFAEWVLGPAREDQQIYIQTSRDEESGATRPQRNPGMAVLRGKSPSPLQAPKPPAILRIVSSFWDEMALFHSPSRSVACAWTIEPEPGSILQRRCNSPSR